MPDLPPSPWSLPQLVGYLALILGVVTFAQTDDRRLRASMCFQGLAYGAHFLLLGSTVAALAAFLTAARAALTLYTRSTWLGAGILVATIALGAITVDSARGWLPVLASAAGTTAFFWFQGIPMRLVLFIGGACWFTNNLLVGSIGGTALEFFLGVVNASTIFRLLRAREQAGAGLGRSRFR